MFDEWLDGWTAKSLSVTCNTQMKTGFLELRLHRSVSPGRFTHTNSLPQANQAGKKKAGEGYASSINGY